MKWWDLVTIIASIIIVGCVLVIIQFYYNSERDECIKDPLAYGSKMIEESYGYTFYGTGLLIIPNGSSFSMSFTSNGTTLE